MIGGKERLGAPILLIGLLAVTVLTGIIPSASAAGVLYLNPNNIPTQPTGTVITYQVKVANVNPFNSWEIMVRTDPTVLSPTDLSIAGNILSTNFSLIVVEQIRCVSGIGNGCTVNDGPGIVHSGVSMLGLPQTSLPMSGLLFAITYQVVGTGVGSVIDPFNDGIFDGTPIPVPHDTLLGTYGTPANFAISLSPSSTTLQAGTNKTTTVILTSLDSFSGTVALSATPSPTSGLQLSFTPTNVTLAMGQSLMSSLTVSTTGSTRPGNYSVTIRATGKSGMLQVSQAVVLTVTVTDFAVCGTAGTFAAAGGCIQSPAFTVVQGSSGNLLIAISALNKFAGNVQLSTSVSATSGFTASMSPTNVELTGGEGQVAFSILTLTSPANAPTGPYSVTVTGTSGGQMRSVNVQLTIVPAGSPDFEIAANPSSLTVVNGFVGTSVVTITSLDRFTALSGTAFLSVLPLSVFSAPSPVALLSEAGFSTPGSVEFSLTSGRTTNSTLTLATLPSTPSGTYVYVVLGESPSPSVSSSGIVHSVIFQIFVTTGTPPPPPVFVESELSWTHHLSLSKSASLQTWTARVFNNATIPWYVQVEISGKAVTGSPFLSFTAISEVTRIAPGTLVQLTVYKVFPGAWVGRQVCFTGELIYSSTIKGSLGQLLFVLISPVTRSGCFRMVS